MFQLSKSSPESITFYARSLLWAILCAVGHIVFMQHGHRSLFDLPITLAPWFFSWIATLCFSILIPRRSPFTAAGFIWIAYTGGAVLFNLETSWFVILSQALFSSVVWLVFEWQEHLHRRLRLSTETMLSARITEARIRPHFFFNVLNALSSMAAPKSKLREGLDDAAELFRYTLGRDHTMSDLESERFFCEGYLRLEKLRLEDRLHVVWDVDDDVEDENPQMPGLILQPVIENAIRHGIEHCEGALFIKIQKYRDYLEIEVSNPVPEEKSVSAGLGVAEQDLQRRLSLLYDQQAFYTRHIEGGMNTTKIRIPWNVVEKRS
jgi:LytS/YehU family sensor histidine kinase